jgi:putative tryptophan/tyrosine transport system substrate-binding protein
MHFMPSFAGFRMPVAAFAPAVRATVRRNLLLFASRGPPKALNDDRMKRRDFLVSMAMFAATTQHASAQQSAKMKRLAVVNATVKPADMRIGGDPIYAVFFEELKRLGRVEGINLIVERYSAEGRFERFAEIAHEIVGTRPDAIFAVEELLTLALKSETRTIPIVGWTSDPVARGIVSSLARPGGNVTGVSVDAGPEVAGKRVALFAEAVGKLTNVRMLSPDPPLIWEQHPGYKAFRAAAEKMNIPVQQEVLQAPIDEAEYRRAFNAMQRDHVDGVFVSSSIANYTNRVLVGRLAQEYRLPAICWYGDSVEAGALMSYSFDLKAAARRAAAQIVEILNGSDPAEMPFFLETHFEFVINLTAAKELGLEVPAGLVAQADRVIE